MNLPELLRSRRTIRRFRPDPVERSLIQELIELAVTAPSASNNQPWRFFVCDDRPKIEKMAGMVQEAVDRIASHLEGEGRAAFEAYGDYFVRFRAAPVIIAPAFRPLRVLSHLVDPQLSGEDRARIEAMEYKSGLASTALAVENLLLYAHWRGLGASCLSGPLVASDRLSQLLRIPLGWELALLVAVGYADEAPARTRRKKAAAVMTWV